MMFGAFILRSQSMGVKGALPRRVHLTIPYQAGRRASRLPTKRDTFVVVDDNYLSLIK